MSAVSCTLQAQMQEPRFEVASVRPNRIAGCAGRWDFRTTRGTVTAENAPLLRIVSRAFEITDDRVSGPGWLNSQCYDIRAKAPGEPLNLMPMLQTLLKERFHLIARRESTERPIFALVIDKGGSKLRPYADHSPVPPASNEGKVLFMARHMPDLCERLGKVTGRLVIDKTGLTGDFMIVLTYATSDAESDIFSAVRDQLGLRLEPQRGVVEMLKIDAIDKVPIGN